MRDGDGDVGRVVRGISWIRLQLEQSLSEEGRILGRCKKGNGFERREPVSGRIRINCACFSEYQFGCYEFESVSGIAPPVTVNLLVRRDIHILSAPELASR